jgi:hypothetical protein
MISVMFHEHLTATQVLRDTPTLETGTSALIGYQWVLRC